MIGHSITYMGMQFVQNVDLKNKSCKQFLVKNKSGATRKNFFFDFFFQLNFFSVFFFKFLNIVCPDRIQKSHMFNKKKL